MARLEDLDPELRTFVEMYAWRRNDPVPWAEARKPLGTSTIGLVATACMTMKDQPRFHAEVEPDNDASMRIIPADTHPQDLVNTFPQQAFDHAGLREDANLLIPLDRLRKMKEAGEIGAPTQSFVSLCGHLPHPELLIEQTAPEIAQVFLHDHADVVLLVPA